MSSGDLRFTVMSDLRDEAQVLAMMQALYAEDAGTAPADISSFPQTIHTLVAQPHRGQIILIKDGGVLVGYALLIPYWSNEFGGTIIYVDELFVMPHARSCGNGRAFFQFIEKNRPFNASAALLEVSPGNSRATKLYESIGFVRRKHATYVWGWGSSYVP